MPDETRWHGGQGVLEGIDLGPGGDAVNVTLVNDTGLPDADVLAPVETFWAENASVGGIANAQFQVYDGGSMLARRRFTTPSNIIEEIKLARDMAERDDDIGATIGMMLSVAFGEGMANFHKDEKTAGFFNDWAADVNLDGVFKEMYREYLIASSVTTISLFTRQTLTFTPQGKRARKVTKQVSVPMIGVIPAEQIRVHGDDTFGTAPLYYVPKSSKQDRWLREYFNPTTTAARKAELRRLSPVWAAAFVGAISVPSEERMDEDCSEDFHYLLNPRYVHRTTMPKGSWAYPRPLLTRDFALLEAKRLLNVMDFALLQGGTNYIIVAKKGSDARPALPAEITNLYQTIRSASRTGVLVGDHRLSLDIVTPDLAELLSPAKRSLLGRKLAMAIQRIPEHTITDPGVEGQRADMEMLGRNVTSDRQDLRRHMESIYDDIVARNPTTFTQGRPKLWFPKIVLSGQDAFNQYVLKLRDRGDIPRRWAVEAAGYDYEASVEQRRTEIANGDDQVLTPGDVPFSNQSQPGDTGRPPGSSPNNGAPNSQPSPSQGPATPQNQLQRTRGETVRAWYDEQADQIIRVGELTERIIDQHEDTLAVGRMTKTELAFVGSRETVQDGALIIVPVNIGHPCDEYRALRLGGGVSLIVGQRTLDGAAIAKAISFKDADYDINQAEERAMRWGFDLPPRAVEDEPEPEPVG